MSQQQDMLANQTAGMDLIDGALGSAGIGGGFMSGMGGAGGLPPMNLKGGESKSGASSNLSSKASFDNSGWTVSTGGGNATAGLTLPSWSVPALLAAGLMLWLKYKK